MSWLKKLESILRGGRFDLKTGEIIANTPKALFHEKRHKWQSEESKFFKPLLKIVDLFWELMFIIVFVWFIGSNIINLIFGWTFISPYYK